MKTASLLLSTLFLITGMSVHAEEVVVPAKPKRQVPQVTNSLERVCEKPRSPLYRAENSFDRLKVELITDYDALNQRYSSAILPGVVKVYRKEKPTEVYPVLLGQRGNSRRQKCSASPFRMQFVKAEIQKKIEETLTTKEIKPESETYVKSYYEELVALQPKPETDVEPHKDGIFKNIGDDVKVVTHCGQADWEFVGGKDEETQNQRLYSEYTVYKVLETLRLPVEATRMATFKYFKKDGTPAYVDEKGVALEKQAFFREPPKSTSDRCGLLSKLDPAGTVKNSGTDPVSEIQTNLINRFIFNNDYGMFGHNMNQYYDVSGKTVFGPYDFDLSGVVVDGYFKNNGTIEDQKVQVMSFVQSSDQKVIKPTLKRIVESKEAMKAAVAVSEISSATKDRFNKWLDLYVGEFETYLKNAAAQEAPAAAEAAPVAAAAP